MAKVKRPALKYHGSKFKIAHWIISHFPEHRCYVDLFGGGAGVLLQKPPAYVEVYNDFDGEVVNFFRVLRDPELGAQLIDRLALTLYSRQEYDASWRPGPEPIERAYAMFVRSWQGIANSTTARKRPSGWSSALTNSRTSRIPRWRGTIKNLPAVVERFLNILIEQRPALDVIDRYDDRDVLFYADPPYLFSTRQRSWAGWDYAMEMTDADHSALLDKLKRVKGMVVLSGYSSPLYDVELAGWRRQEIATYTDGLGKHRKKAKECLWMNQAVTEKLDGRLF